MAQLNCTEVFQSSWNSPISRKSEYSTKVQRQPHREEETVECRHSLPLLQQGE